jgi:hypothetical protein
MGSRPKAPKPSAADTAMIMRQSMELDKTIATNEKRLKAISRGKLVSKSLLGTAADAARKEVGDGSYSANATMLPMSSGKGMIGRIQNKVTKKSNESISYSGEK